MSIAPTAVTAQDGSIIELPSVTEFLNGLLSVVPALIALLLVIVASMLLRRWLERGTPGAADSHQMRNQLLLLGLSTLGGIVVILLLPIGDTLRGQILSLIGIVLSAGIALSSTTFLGNMLAGVMLRAVKSFRIGDFVRVEEHFGRVSERGLFHTEIQTEDRDLTTLPNLFLVTNPVTTVRTSGTIVSAFISLGYDVSHSTIEPLLLEGARVAGLEDPFVLVQDLGDFAVTYRVAGMLTDVKSLISARSRLRTAVLDALHGGGVEIVSPTFMNQRRLDAEQRFIPTVEEPGQEREPGAPAPEELVFDKAEEAESKEEMKESVAEIEAEIESREQALAEATETARPSEEQRLERLRRHKERLERLLTEAAEKTAEEKGHGTAEAAEAGEATEGAEEEPEAEGTEPGEESGAGTSGPEEDAEPR